MILVRHCQSSGQAPDAPLTEAGAAAAEALADELSAHQVDAVYSSPLRRAVATVEPFARRTGLKIHLDDRLVERRLSAEDRDDWLTHLERSFADANYRLETGESLTQAQARGLAALAAISAMGWRRPVVASHGNLISCILRAVDPTFGFQDWRALRNPDLFELQLVAGAPIAFSRITRPD
jgi:2,3-bisphosphoglycerate-dependent phosphoglycerate mutase